MTNPTLDELREAIHDELATMHRHVHADRWGCHECERLAARAVQRLLEAT